MMGILYLCYSLQNIHLKINVQLFKICIVKEFLPLNLKDRVEKRLTYSLSLTRCSPVNTSIDNKSSWTWQKSSLTVTLKLSLIWPTGISAATPPTCSPLNTSMHRLGHGQSVHRQEP